MDPVSQKIWDDFVKKSVHETGYWFSAFTADGHAHIHCYDLAKWLIEFLSEHKNKVIYDFGCGDGFYLQQLYSNGIKNVIGIEPETPSKSHSFKILPHNLAFDLPLTEKGIVMSFEVGEHIPKKYQDVFIDNITKLCDSYLILSWAIVDQPGIGHVNCKNNSDVINILEQKGFTYLPDLTEIARSYPDGMCGYYKQTLMIFKK